MKKFLFTSQLFFCFLKAEEYAAECTSSLYRNNLKNRFLTASAFPHASCSLSRLASRQWSLAPNTRCAKLSCQNFDIEAPAPTVPSLSPYHETRTSSQPDAAPLTYPSSLPMRPYKSAALSAGLSSLIPGLGHYYIGDTTTASQLSSCWGMGVALQLCFPGDQLSQDIRFAGAWTTEVCSFYGIYAAYRDARLHNGDSFYSFKRMPTERFSDLIKAPFRLSVLRKPEVYAGYVGSLALATLVMTCYPPPASASSTHYRFRSIASLLYPFTAFLVGLSEESLFRGYLQSQLCEISNPILGIVLSSLVFGAAHIGNAASFSPEHLQHYCSVAIPFITMMGGYLGWACYKNSSLQECVALHSWYDFTLFSLQTLGEAAGQTFTGGNREFKIGFSF